MKSSNANSGNDYNACVFEYEKAVCDLEDFKASGAAEYLKGFIRYKCVKSKSGNARYYPYYIRVDYVNGKSERKETYIRKEDFEKFQENIAQIPQNRQRYKELKKKVRALEKKLQRIMKKEKIDDDIFQKIKENRRKHKDFKEKDQYESPIILSAFGEAVRSRGECILANLAFAFKIPYMYEPEVALRGYNEIDDLINEKARPDFKFYINKKSIFLELLGMSGSDEYDQNWENKRRKYETCGIVQGENLISVACKDRQNINSQKVAQVLLDMMRGIIPKGVVYV